MQFFVKPDPQCLKEISIAGFIFIAAGISGVVLLLCQKTDAAICAAVVGGVAAIVLSGRYNGAIRRMRNTDLARQAAMLCDFSADLRTLLDAGVSRQDINALVARYQSEGFSGCTEAFTRAYRQAVILNLPPAQLRDLAHVLGLSDKDAERICRSAVDAPVLAGPPALPYSEPTPHTPGAAGQAIRGCLIAAALAILIGSVWVLWLLSSLF